MHKYLIPVYKKILKCTALIAVQYPSYLLLTKMLERLVHNYLFIFLEMNSVIYDLQLSF